MWLIEPRVLSQMYPTVTLASFTLPKSHASFVVVFVVDVVLVLCQYWHCHIKSFRSHYSPEVDSACSRNEYRSISWKCSWRKGGRCARLTTLPPSCAVVMKSGNLNFLESSGTLQACKRTALPFLVLSQLSFASI